MVKLSDVKVGGEISLLLLVGKTVADIRGYFSGEFGGATLMLTSIEFTDGTKMSVEGEHDFPYVADYRSEPQPNFDDETLQRLLDEQYAEDED